MAVALVIKQRAILFCLDLYLDDFDTRTGILFFDFLKIKVRRQFVIQHLKKTRLN